MTMNEHENDDFTASDDARRRPARRPMSAATLGAFGAGAMLVVILLYLAY